MCGRIGLTASSEEIKATYKLTSKPTEVITGKFNLTPGQMITVFSPGLQVTKIRWGFTNENNHFLINARLETFFSSTAWKSWQPCIVPASFFYEWQVNSFGRKVPWVIQPTSNAMFQFAGLFEPAHSTVVILTTAACPLLKSIHNHGNNRFRQPMVLDNSDFENWLQKKLTAENYDTKGDQYFEASELEKIGDDLKGNSFIKKRQQLLF